MQDRPSLSELTLAVREFLETEIAPVLSDPRLKFRTLVAMNALGMIARESELEEPLVREECSSLIGLLSDLIDKIICINNRTFPRFHFSRRQINHSIRKMK